MFGSVDVDIMQLKNDKIKELLNPLSIELPCGIYIKNDNQAFRALRNEFNLAQSTLRKLVQNPDMEEKEQVENECHEAWSKLSDNLYEKFCTVTRDIELIGWFITSQFIIDKTLDSVANSFTWLTELVTKQWDVLNPVLPEDKLKSESESGKINEQNDVKIKAFFQMVGDSETSSLLYTPIIFQPIIGDVTFFDYQSAERKGKLNDLKDSIKYNLEQEREIIQIRQENIFRCLTQLAKMESFFAEKKQHSGMEAVKLDHLVKLFSKLENAFQFLSGFSVKKPTNIDERNIETSSDLQDGLSHYRNVNESSITVLNRDAEFHKLREISHFFRKNEPHSPVSYLLEKAIRWGYLSLPELFQELLLEQNNDAIVKIFSAVGLNHLEPIKLPELPEPQIQHSSEKKSTLGENKIGPELGKLQTSVQESISKPASSSTTALSW